MGLPPNDTVYKIISLPRWQREWVNSHRAINFSGMVQEMLSEVIKQNNPEYFEANLPNILQKEKRRMETTLVYMKTNSKGLF